MAVRRFPLEAVLMLRERREEERQAALGVAVRRLEAERAALAALRSSREAVLRRMADEQSAGSLDLDSLARYPAFLEALAVRTAEGEALVGQAEAEVLAAQSALAEATSAVKAVEKLRDDWVEARRVAELRVAERVLDEIALARHGHRAPGDLGEARGARRSGEREIGR